MNFYKNEKCIFVDESGNLGQSGRYFVLSCIETGNYKSIYNLMTKKIHLAKIKFKELNIHAHEIKAKEAYPAVKYHILECLSKKDIMIHYIVADLHHVDMRLLNDKNIFYNYLTRLLLDCVIKRADNKVNIIFDNHSTKVLSTNSLSEYLKIHYNFEKQYSVELNIVQVDSDTKYGYCTQAIDYIANAIYGKYEYNDNQFFNIFKNCVKSELKFPISEFGI